MREQNGRAILEQVLAQVQRRIFLTTAAFWLVRAGIIILPLVALMVAAGKRWNQEALSLWAAGMSVLALVGFAMLMGRRGLGEKVRCALALDDKAA